MGFRRCYGQITVVWTKVPVVKLLKKKKMVPFIEIVESLDTFHVIYPICF